ncbi:hypothetical protein C7H52_04160 [Aurantibacter aestuarii]|uniref:OmpA-like domain-containing protein n=1 Tax=Aurantibacter aestuarii TaxID=1266046 RepID=A0A2T1NDG5_9FLAO|nr:hypothetical protein C7H52_04160 [Aurantibacter aestuarii]
MKLNYLIFLLSFSFCSAQNLVKNPSFEEFKFCPENNSQFNNNVISWSLPNKGTSDYYNTCSTFLNDKNPHGYQNPQHGNGYAGIVVYYENMRNTLKDYREYIQGELKDTLIKDKRYVVKIRISLADKANFTINELALVLTNQAISSSKDSYIDINNITIDSFTYKKVNFKYKPFYHIKDRWMTLEKEFVASGFEKFLCFGNFNSDLKTEKLKIDKHLFPIESYYYIDNISIEPVSLYTFQLEKTYTFKNVLFDFDKAELLDDSIEELDKLYQHLEENKTLNITIYGHTDNVGLDSRNKELSEQRAEAVSNYLISKGLNPERIKWFGFGADAPITTNDTEENRAKNRRVEFKLTEK